MAWEMFCNVCILVIVICFLYWSNNFTSVLSLLWYKSCNSEHQKISLKLWKLEDEAQGRIEDKTTSGNLVPSLKLISRLKNAWRIKKTRKKKAYDPCAPERPKDCKAHNHSFVHAPNACWRKNNFEELCPRSKLISRMKNTWRIMKTKKKAYNPSAPHVLKIAQHKTTHLFMYSTHDEDKKKIGW